MEMNRYRCQRHLLISADGQNAFAASSFEGDYAVEGTNVASFEEAPLKEMGSTGGTRCTFYPNTCQDALHSFHKLSLLCLYVFITPIPLKQMPNAGDLTGRKRPSSEDLSRRCLLTLEVKG